MPTRPDEPRLAALEDCADVELRLAALGAAAQASG
jgi:hypothetical protein